MRIQENIRIPFPENTSKSLSIFRIQLNEIPVQVKIFSVTAITTFLWRSLPCSVESAPIEASANIVNRDNANY